jgi:hypothetical protein
MVKRWVSVDDNYALPTAVQNALDTRINTLISGSGSGAQWYSGGGAPATGTGVLGDWYLNTLNGAVYEKTGTTTWTLRTNITGPQGSAGLTGGTGTQGSRWYSGGGVPAGATGIISDWYLNVTNGDVYEKTGATTWTFRDNITGPQSPLLRNTRVGVQVHANTGEDGTTNHFNAHRTLENSLGVTFDQFSYYMTINSTTSYSGVAEYTNAIGALLASDPSRHVMLVLENFCAHPTRNGNLYDTTVALANPTDQFTINTKALADAIVSIGYQERVHIALMHECNAGGEPWQIYVDTVEALGNTSALFISAYQGIVNMMRGRGVTADFIQWFLTSNSGGGTADYSVHYAGDNYVSTIGLTYYNRCGLVSSGYQYWEPIGHSLREPMRMIERMSARPVWICESSCVSETTDTTKSWFGKSKAEWLASALRMLRTGDFPRIELWTLFLVDVSATETGRNWTLETAEQQRVVALEIKKLGRPDPYRVGDPSWEWSRNLLPPTVEFPSSTALWTSSGATLAIDPSQPWELDVGVGSLKVTRTASTLSTSTSNYARYSPPDDSYYISADSYVLSFWAKCSVDDFKIAAGIRQVSSPTNYIGDDNIKLSPSWRHYVVQIGSGTSRSGGWRIPFFGVGANSVTADIYFTGIRFSRGVRPGPPVDRILQKRTGILVDGATITPTVEVTEIGKVTLAGNRTLATPAGTPVDGQDYWLHVKQDATGTRTLTLSAGYAVSPDVPFTLSTAANLTDVARFTYDSTSAKWRLMSLLHGF